MDDIAIKVEGVSKTFKLPHEKQTSLKGAFINLFKGGNRSFEKQQALKDITFDIKKGEFFSIVGRNGSGKSTLLKLLAGIYSPNSGNIQINGKLTPFIELGVGFNPELTGRENVFLNSALLGFSRKEVNAMYEDIVAFAEIERFMDQKLKNYSTGMQVRLAFSIAIQAKSDILVLDEVLAVGDEAFQQKCISVFENYKARQQTIVLVTHDMEMMERFSTKALMLQDSKVIEIGSPTIIAQMYRNANKDAYDLSNNYKNDSNLKIQTLDRKTGKLKKRFVQGDEILVHLRWIRNDSKYAGVAIVKQSGEYIFGANSYQDNTKLSPGSKDIYYITRLNLAAGEYILKAGLYGRTDSEVLEFVDEGPHIIVGVRPQKKKKEEIEGRGKWGGMTYLPHAWGGKEITI